MSYRVIHREGKVIRADYAGGPYVELTFGSEGYHPTEVINVWDYAAGEAQPPWTLVDDMTNEEFGDALREEVDTWIRSNEEEGWESWYEDYLANA